MPCMSPCCCSAPWPVPLPDSSEPLLTESTASMRKPTLYQSLRAKNRSQSMVVGVTWYNETTWAEVKATATDPECFEDSFAQWKAVAVAARRNFQRAGVLALECHIEPQEFFAWCARNNQPNNSTSRGEYVSEKLSGTSRAS
jgi:hypothetical protein